MQKYKDGWACDWLPVKERIRFDRLVMTHKILHGNCPDNLQNKFTRRSQISNYSTRNSQNLHLPKPRLEFTKKSFQFTGASAWNEIPQQHRDLPSLNCFKKEVKQLLRSWGGWMRFGPSGLAMFWGVVLYGYWFGCFRPGWGLWGAVFRDVVGL